MSLSLHKNCRKRMLELLRDVYPKIMIQNDYFIEVSNLRGFFGVLDSPLPKNGENIDILESAVGGNSFSTFVASELLKKLQSSNDISNDSSLKCISEYDGFGDANEVCSNLLDKFCELPYRYIVSVELPQCFFLFFNDDRQEIVINERMKLLYPDEEFSTLYPLDNKVSLNSFGYLGRGYGVRDVLDTTVGWDRRLPYLQMEVDGYFARGLTTTTVERCLDLFKSLLGTFISLGPLGYKYKSSSEKSMVQMYLHSSDNKTIQHEGVINLDPEISNTLKNIQFDDLGGRLGIDEFRQKFSRFIVSDVCKLFQHETGEEKIVSACRWFFESQNTVNNLLSYLYLTIVTEILLGNDKNLDGIGITSLLSNRCAYLIGKTQEERSQILSDFKEIYDTRSQIVHRGKSRLSSKEWLDLQKLKVLCKRIIKKEVDLIER